MITDSQAELYRKAIRSKPDEAEYAGFVNGIAYYKEIDGVMYKWVTEMGFWFWRKLEHAAIVESIEEMEALLADYKPKANKEVKIPPLPGVVIDLIKAKPNLSNERLAEQIGCSPKQVEEARRQLNKG